MILQFEIDAQHVDMRLDEFFYLHGISKKLVKDSRNHGEILVNGEKQYLCYKTVEGDSVAIVFPKETSNVIPVDIPLKVVYEDDYLMIIDKQPNLACIPVKKYLTESVGNAIMYYYKVNHIESAIHLVNRLDKETSGLMMIAKSRYVHDAFSHDIKQVKRVYHALVEGNPGQGTVNAPIDHAEGHGTKRKVREGGKEAITHYRTIKTIGEYSLVECKLETGRTHQIRVHMAYLGCPLVGDPLYGEGEGFYLDSVEIAFRHPITQQCMTLKKVFNDVRIKKLNLKQSEKYMTYKCNEYGKHYKKFSRIIPVVVIITLVAAFIIPSQAKVIYALGVAITAGLFFMVYSYYKQMVSLKEVPTVPCEYVVAPVKYNERVQLKTTKGDDLLFAFVEKSRSIYKNEREALIIYVPESGHIYGEHVALLKDIKG